MRCSAALLAIAAACGSHETPFPFGGPDAAGNALPTTGDAAPGAVTIAITQNGLPAAGVAVYFQNMRSTLVVAASTDVNGTAAAVVPDQSSVTVIEPPDGTSIPKLATFGSVKPGDMLHLDLPPVELVTHVDVAITVPTIAGATVYQIYTECGMVTIGVSGTGVTALDGCGGTTDVVVVPYDAVPEPLGSIYAPTQALEGGTIAITGSYTPFAPATFEYSDIPETINDIQTTAEITTTGGILYSANGAGPSLDGAASVMIDLPTTSGAVGLTVTTGVPAPGALFQEQIFEWAPWSPSYQLDVGAALIRPFKTAPVYDYGQRQVTWIDSGGLPIDFARIRVLVSRDDFPPRTWSWSLIDEASIATTLAIPVLPGAAAMFNPMFGDTVAIEELTCALVPGGYDAFRPHGFDNLGRMVTGTSGRMVVETMYSTPL